MIDRRKMLTRIVQSFSIFGAFFVGYPFIKSSSIFEKRQLELEIDLSDLSIVKVTKTRINNVKDGSKPKLLINTKKYEVILLGLSKLGSNR